MTKWETNPLLFDRTNLDLIASSVSLIPLTVKAFCCAEASYNGRVWEYWPKIEALFAPYRAIEIPRSQLQRPVYRGFEMK